MKTIELWKCDLSVLSSEDIKGKLSAYKMLINTTNFLDNARLQDIGIEIITRLETELLHRKEIFIDDGVTPKQDMTEFIRMSMK